MVIYILKSLKELTSPHMIAILQCLPRSTVQEIFATGLAVIIRRNGTESLRENASSMLHFAKPNTEIDDGARINQFTAAYQFLRDKLTEHLELIFQSGLFSTENPNKLAVDFSAIMLALLGESVTDSMNSVRQLHRLNSGLCDAMIWGGFAAIIRNMAEINQIRKGGGGEILRPDAFLVDKLRSLMILGMRIDEAVEFTSNVVHSLDDRTGLESMWVTAGPMLRLELLRYIIHIFILPLANGGNNNIRHFSVGPIVANDDVIKRVFSAQLELGIENVRITSNSKGISRDVQDFITRERTAFDNGAGTEKQRIEGEERVRLNREAEDHRRRTAPLLERERQQRMLKEQRRATKEVNRKAKLLELRRKAIQDRSDAGHNKNGTGATGVSNGGGDHPAHRHSHGKREALHDGRRPPATNAEKRPRKEFTSQFPLFSPTLTPSLQILSDAFDSVRLC